MILKSVLQMYMNIVNVIVKSREAIHQISFVFPAQLFLTIYKQPKKCMNVWKWKMVFIHVHTIPTRPDRWFIFIHLLLLKVRNDQRPKQRTKKWMPSKRVWKVFLFWTVKSVIFHLYFSSSFIPMTNIYLRHLRNRKRPWNFT